MAYFTKAKNKGKLQPDYVASSVAYINFDALSQNGIKCVAFDIDGTLTKNNSLEIDMVFAKELKKKIDKAGINKKILASNSIRSLNVIAKAIDATEVHQPHNYSGKPSKAYYKELINKSGFQPNQVAMIGDRWLQDTWGAKRAGLKTVLVELLPEYVTFRDKVIFRHLWQPLLVRRKAIKKRQPDS